VYLEAFSFRREAPTSVKRGITVGIVAGVSCECFNSATQIGFSFEL
jgi:hypothetical protein